MSGRTFTGSPRLTLQGLGLPTRPARGIRDDLEELDEEVEELEDWRRSKEKHEREEHSAQIDAELRFELFEPLLD